MELSSLSEIPDLNGIFSDEQFLYVPLQDERIMLSAVLGMFKHSDVNIGYQGMVTRANRQYALFRPSGLVDLHAEHTVVPDELYIDRGWGIIEGKNMQSTADYVFRFGEQYAQQFLWYKQKYELPLAVDSVPADQTVPVDPSGFALQQYCRQNKYFFLHPISMSEVGTTAQFFIPAFQRRYGAAFKLAGDVYENEYRTWVFVEGTQATLGQVFLLGVSWTLNKQRIETMHDEESRRNCKYFMKLG